ncbi:hypothetical protein ASF43_05745 [Pseudorhodoferax sp. Leaf267]|nr:hypothetical protein ASF43_05745 [Pseudorhodoferax sp. Leaf267]
MAFELRQRHEDRVGLDQQGTEVGVLRMRGRGVLQRGADGVRQAHGRSHARARCRRRGLRLPAVRVRRDARPSSAVRQQRQLCGVRERMGHTCAVWQ